MLSFNAINYSLRPSKTIQRSLVFASVRALQSQMNLDNLVYIGFGSIWFTDFFSAHKELLVDDMISIEATEIGFKRAEFNCPFRTIRVSKGLSNVVLPALYSDEALIRRPWMIWLDYDGFLAEDNIDDIRRAIESLPPNSILLTTFNARGRAYGDGRQRPERLRALLGAVVPDELGRDECIDRALPATLADLTTKFMVSVAAESARPGGFLPAFRVAYVDSTPMVTVGGILPAKGAAPAVKAALADPTWLGIVPGQIVAPHLTLKEVSALQTKLPSITPLTRDVIQGLGFDLEDEQIATFQRFYRYYPTYVQMTT